MFAAGGLGCEVEGLRLGLLVRGLGLRCQNVGGRADLNP